MKLRSTQGVIGKFGALALLITLSMSLSGCTIIRYVDNNEPEPPEPKPIEPKVMDMLVMVELDRSATSMAESYQQILASLTLTLTEKKITLRKVALAPMYRRTGAAVPLIYGLGDEGSEFSNYGEAIFFFANDDGQMYLRDRASADGENLAALGQELDTRSLYHPTTADPDAIPYFTEPADGFMVVQITAKARTCAYSDAACQLDGTNPGSYFTRSSEQETAAWLQLGGQRGLKKDKIFHLFIATAEQTDIDGMITKCERIPDFPAGKLDYMEPSSKSYYEPLAEQIKGQGGKAQYVDLCTAMSTIGGLAAMRSVAGSVRQMF